MTDIRNDLSNRYAEDSPYHDQWLDFLAATRDHRLSVMLDTETPGGVFRSLRMGQPGHSCWHWNLDTRPGYLHLTGDVCDGVTFGNHDADMLTWADRTGHRRYADDAPVIDMGYWAEKIRGITARSRRGPVDAAYVITDASVTETLTRLFLDHVVDDWLNDWTVEYEERINGDYPDADGGSPWEMFAFAAACHHIYTSTIVDLSTDINGKSSSAREYDLHEMLMDNEELFGQYDGEVDFTDISGDTVRACFAVDATVTAYRHHQLLSTILTSPTTFTPTLDVPGTTGVRVSLDDTHKHGTGNDLDMITFTVTVPKGHTDKPYPHDLIQYYNLTWDRLDTLNPTYARLLAGDVCDTLTPDRIITRGPLNPANNRYAWHNLDSSDNPTDNWPDIPVVLTSVGYFIENVVNRYRKILQL